MAIQPTRTDAPDSWKVKIKAVLAKLKATRNLERGKEIHAEAIESGYDNCIYVANSLIHMYAKCGSMVDAHRVFDSIENPSVVSWNNLILGYAESGEGRTALDLFVKMRSQGCVPDSFTFVSAIKSCTSLALEENGIEKKECLRKGKTIHSEICGHCSIYVQNTLIDMYAKCGSMFDARKVFDSISLPNVVSWNALILGYADNGEGVTALALYGMMKVQGSLPNSITFVAALKACICLAMENGGREREKCLEFGKQIHSDAGWHLDNCVESTLIDMYSICGSMVDARHFFDSIKKPDVVTWNTLILGYVDNREAVNALEMFAKMRTRGCTADSFTFVAALKACSSLALENNGMDRQKCLELGKIIHLETGSHYYSIYVQNALLDMYSKCGSMSDAAQVFETIKQPNVISWNSLIFGYAENGEGLTALDLFARMRTETVFPNSVTFVAALKACAFLALEKDKSNRAECLERGKQIHSEMNCYMDVYEQTTLIDMYAKCGSMVEARKVFDEMKHPDVVSWNTLILGYAENGESVIALDLFAAMRSQGCAPDCITYVAVLKASGFLGAVEFGSKIHAEMDPETRSSEFVVTSLVDFYSKCGCPVEAQKVFDAHPKARNLTTWNALLAGYSRLGDKVAVSRLFASMEEAGFQPNGGTFLSILTCCIHAGLCVNAKDFFEAMSTYYAVIPSGEHYTCMVDILGRSNKLEDALAFLRSMTCKPNAVTWMTVLDACHKWKSVRIGKLAFDVLVSLDEDNAAVYVLMSRIYKSKGMWEEQKMMLGHVGTRAHLRKDEVTVQV